MADIKAKTNTYEVSYFYHATGMENGPDVIEKTAISANSKDEAVFKFWQIHDKGPTAETFEEFMKQPAYVRNWGVTIKQNND